MIEQFYQCETPAERARFLLEMPLAHMLTNHEALLAAANSVAARDYIHTVHAWMHATRQGGLTDVYVQKQVMGATGKLAWVAETGSE